MLRFWDCGASSEPAQAQVLAPGMVSAHSSSQVIFNQYFLYENFIARPLLCGNDAVSAERSHLNLLSSLAVLSSRLPG